MNHRHDELIQRVLEGTATADERARLDAAAAADPAVRRRREELEHVFQLLGSAQLETPPAGIRDAVLRQIQDEESIRAGSARVPTPARPAPRDIPWGRLLFPVAAALCAVTLLWAVRGPWNAPAGHVSGTMSVAPVDVTVTLGGGPAAVRLATTPAAGGFRIEVRNGDAPAEVELTALDPAVGLAISPGSAARAPATLSQVIQPRARWTVHGFAEVSEVPVRVVVRFADGHSSSATMRVRAAP